MLQLHPVLGVTPAVKELKGYDFATLRVPATLTALDLLAGQIVAELESGEAVELAGALEETLKRFPQFEFEAPAEYTHYQELIVRLQYHALDLIREESVENLLTDRLLFAVRNEIDVKAKLYLRFLLFEDGAARGVLRKRVIEFMRRNGERLGEEPVIILGTPETRPPTLSNWFSDYEQFFPVFTLRGSLERLRYISEGVNTKKLKEEDRARLLRVLEIYDFVRFPSVALKEQGEVLPSPAPAAAASPLSVTELMAKVDADLSAGERLVMEASQSEIPKIARLFYDNLFPLPGVRYDRAYVLGALVALARKEWLLKILEEPNPVKEAFVKYLREEGKAEELQGFQLAPTAPMSLGKFLRFVLVRRMRMPESDAAQIAVRVGNILKSAGKPEYFDMAYFDQSTGTFKWKT